MSKRSIVITMLVVAASLLVWLMPVALRAIPSRYVAAYLPEPIQTLSVREHADVLPTTVASADTDDLLVARPVIASPESTLSPPIVTRQERSDDRGASAPATPTPLPSPTSSPTAIPIPPSQRLEGFNHIFQTWNNCGPATLAMALTYFGLGHSQEQTAKLLKPDPEDRNVSPYEIVDYVHSETDLAAISRTNGDLDTLRRLIANDVPVIVELGIDPPGEYRWMGWYGHYLLVVAYDDQTEQVWVYDSWFGTSEVPGENADDEGRMISYRELDRYWRQFNRNYIAFYQPRQETLVQQIIGPAMDDENMWRASLERAQTELAAEPDNPFLWFNLGTNYNAVGDHERAASAFDQARSIGLPWRMLWYQFGPYEAYYEVGRYEDILLLADTTLKDRPYFEESYYYKGLALQALGDHNEAERMFRRAVRFNPNFTPAVDELAAFGD
ncbi:MAG: C39 family peptidase [Candidatus Promineifilaceae bacterium]|nr:C39 family peptidase [Candidatus Promineifilaceae bacterium]